MGIKRPKNVGPTAKVKPPSFGRKRTIGAKVQPRSATSFKKPVGGKIKGV